MRRKPYTKKGISRIPCVRCGALSAHQFQICSLENEWLGVCNKCDIELNILVLKFMRFKNWQQIIKKYIDLEKDELCAERIIKEHESQADRCEALENAIREILECGQNPMWFGLHGACEKARILLRTKKAAFD